MIIMKNSTFTKLSLFLLISTSFSNLISGHSSSRMAMGTALTIGMAYLVIKSKMTALNFAPSCSFVVDKYDKVKSAEVLAQEWQISQQTIEKRTNQEILGNEIREGRASWYKKICYWVGHY